MTTSRSSGDEGIVLSRTTLVWIAVAFLLIGVAVSVYGPLLGQLVHRFGVTLPVAGEVLTAHFSGGLAGVLISMQALARLSNRQFLGAALGCLSLGCALAALAPAWPVLLAGVFVIGMGFGSISMGLNQIVAHSEGGRRSAVINAVNASVGVGAVVGPILVAALGQGRYVWLYAAIAIVAVGLIPQGLKIPGRLPRVQGGSARRPKALMAFFLVGFAMYVGTEAGVGGWMTSHLESLGLSFASAAALTSGFWLAFAFGRTIAALLPARVGESTIIFTASAVAALALLGAFVGPIAPIAYLVVGLALAPIFPTGVVWLSRLVPRDSAVTSWLFPAGMLGGALVPAGVGLVVGHAGLGAAPGVLAGVAAVTFAAFFLAARVGAPTAARR
ncbi:MAG: MFS transporter [Opitutales bacterium]